MAAPTPTDRSLDQDVVVLACALSAGVHAGLVPEHMKESPLLGVSFVAAAVLAALLAFALPRARGSVVLPGAAAVLLGGLIVAYGLSSASGLPLLGAEQEALDPLGVATKAIELTGLVCAVRLITEPMRSAGGIRAGRPIREVRSR
jgi:peptidoglycan/LPS O-acetylase OafA/YrhL